MKSGKPFLRAIKIPNKNRALKRGFFTFNLNVPADG